MQEGDGGDRGQPHEAHQAGGGALAERPPPHDGLGGGGKRVGTE